MMGERPDVQQVLEHYGVNITGLHGNRQVLCPVVPENVPSCSVNLDKGLIHCFGCGFAGDSISLIMEKEHCDYPGALSFAERHFGFAAPARPLGRPGLDGRRAGYRPKHRRTRPGLSR
jgi:DNA primase